MTNIIADLRYALRGLRRSPLFAAVAVMSLALGIGANTAIFTLIDQIVLRKLPIKDPNSLVMLYESGSHMGNNLGERMHSYPMYQDIQSKAAPFSEVLARRLISTSLSVDNQTERGSAEMVSGNYFSMLGVKAAVGRVFSSEEDDRVYQGHNLRHIPGVTDAAFTSVPLLHGDEWDGTMSVEGHEAKDGEDMQGFLNSPSPGYFRTMGIPVLEGRDFDQRDVRPDSKVAIVNQQFEKHFFGDSSAVGHHVGRGSGPGTKMDIEIIGVVANTLYEGPREGVRRQVFLPNYGNGSVTFYMRTVASSGSVQTAVRDSVKTLDASLPVYELKTLERQLDETLLTERLIALLSGGFGLLATLLAAIGLYGVMAFVVGQRTKELGVRLALGAMRSSVVWLVMKEVLTLLAIGLLVGVPTAIALGRYVSSQLYNIKGTDPWIAASMVLLLACVGIAAGLIPAYRASRIDPLLALRFE